METRIFPTDPPAAERAGVAEAVRLLEAGEVVALPTETVYGLAADATNPEAVAKVFAAKERPSFDPLIVHLPSRDALGEVAAEVCDTVARLADEFWPGPLTFVLPKTGLVPDLVTSGMPTVAVRMSANPVFKKVARALGRPVAAPSANRFGRISPTSAAAVMEELGGRIPAVLDGGACAWGLESTIVRVQEGGPKPLITIVRAGPVTVEELKKFGKVVVPPAGSSDAGAPGQQASHYAPRTPLRLLASPEEFVAVPGKKYALLSYRASEKDGFVGLHAWHQQGVLSPGSGKLPEASVRLFFVLRQLDACGADEIICEPVPERGLGLAIMDRLRRAAV
ncbi:L-threonylcarbamoyladenylate synthase [soil metagenome]